MRRLDTEGEHSSREVAAGPSSCKLMPLDEGDDTSCGEEHEKEDPVVTLLVENRMKAHSDSVVKPRGHWTASYSPTLPG